MAIWRLLQALTNVKRRDASGKLGKIAEGFECWEKLTAMIGDQPIVWQERRLIIHSLAHAKAAERGLSSRLQKAQTAIQALTRRKQGKEPFTEAEPLRQAAEALLEQYDIQGLLQVQITDQVQEQHIRKYGDRPAETRLEHQLSLTVQETKLPSRKRFAVWDGGCMVLTALKACSPCNRLCSHTGKNTWWNTASAA